MGDPMTENTIRDLLDPMATEERGALMTPRRALEHWRDRERSTRAAAPDECEGKPWYPPEWNGEGVENNGDIAWEEGWPPHGPQVEMMTRQQRERQQWRPHAALVQCAEFAELRMVGRGGDPLDIVAYRIVRIEEGE